MTHPLLALLAKETDKLDQAGLYKREIVVDDDETAEPTAIDFTRSDYLGLATDAAAADAAMVALEEHRRGVPASRPFGGTRPAHQQLERAVAEFLGQPDAIVYGSHYLANLGLLSCLLDSRDAVFCDAWVHPSLAESARLSGARAVPYANADLEDLEDKLKRSRAARFRVIATDGVFPFSGQVAALADVCELAERYEAMVVVDDALGLGVIGDRGRGACAHRDVASRVHAITGTFANALGCPAGGFVAGSRALVEWLRQKSAPYLFSPALAPSVVARAHHALGRIASGDAPFDTLRDRADDLRIRLRGARFQVTGGEHPLTTVAVGDAVTLQKLVNQLFEYDIRVHGLCYPVVPEREARIRLEVTARHTEGDVDAAARAFTQAGRKLGVIK